MMFALMLGCAALGAASVPHLTVKGRNLVDSKGKNVLLKGVNAGNWLMLEMWMFGWPDSSEKPNDQYDMFDILNKRFGKEESHRLMDVYRDSWMTDRDWSTIAKFGFNVVRLPFDYRLLEDDNEPMHLRKDAFRWLDKGIADAEKHGLYTILDLHGVQGGQSIFDHTGHSGQNKLWKSEKDQERMAWLWKQIAARYRNRDAVVAYDVFNEPYGGSHEDLKSVFSRCYKSIREVDKDKLIFAHGASDTFTFYGDPKANGWKNVGFQMHYYPGLFGNGDPTPMVHARHLASMDGVAAVVDKLNVPFLIGEFNVVFGKNSHLGAPMQRLSFDTYAEKGWNATMWAYKVMSHDGAKFEFGNWGIVTSKYNAPYINFKTASKSEIEKYFKGYATLELAEYDDLRKEMLSKHPTKPKLPEIPRPFKVAPVGTPPAGWSFTEIGDGIKGSAKVEADGTLSLYGSGGDIWGGQDQFGFMHRKVTGDFELTATVVSLLDTNTYAKAGLMLRSGLASSAGMVLVSTFPSGEVQMAVREKAGDQAHGIGDGAKPQFPVTIKLARLGNKVTTYVRQVGVWQELGTTTVTSESVDVGLVSLSHVEHGLTVAKYKNITFKQGE